MPHTFENIDFDFGAGEPATLFGIRFPFEIVAGAQILTLEVNGSEVSTTIAVSATGIGDISAQFLSDLGVVATDDSGILKVTTQETGETSTLVVIPSGAATALCLEGDVQGITHPDSPSNWTVETLEDDLTEYDPFIFGDADSPHVETWGIADVQQKFSDKLLFRPAPDEERLESFGAWEPGDFLFESGGVFVDLLFYDPTTVVVTTGPDIDPPAGAATQTQGLISNFENWAPSVIVDIPETVPNRLIFEPGGSSFLENWGVIIASIPTGAESFLYAESPTVSAVTLENFQNALQGDVVIECVNGSTTVTSVTLNHINIDLDAADTSFATMVFNASVAEQTGTGVDLAQIIHSKMKLNTSIAATIVSEADLGYGADTALRFIVVFSRTPETTRLDGPVGSPPLMTISTHIFDGSGGPFGIILEPDTHWQRRFKYGID